MLIFSPAGEGGMSETRKLAAILVTDVVGYSRLAGADEDRTLARLRGLRGDLIDPAINAHRGRIVKRTGDGIIVEFRSVVDAVRCAIELQNGLIERNAGVPAERRIEFRVGIHVGDVVEESDGDLMGDGVNIAARLEGVARPGAIFLSEDAYRQVKGRLDVAASDLGPTQVKNIADPIIGLRHLELGAAELGLGHFDAAAEEYHKAIDTGFVNYLPYVELAIAHSLEGKTEGAKTALAEARRLNPKLTVQWMKDHSLPPGFGNSAQGRAAGRMSETRFPRYYEPLRHPRAPGLSLTGVRLVLSSLT
jgi:class 3 adenylate cyclase